MSTDHVATAAPGHVSSPSRSDLVLRITLVIAGLITTTPALAVISTSAIDYYGVETNEPMVTALLQHRGVLQLALGAALIWAAVRPDVLVPVAVTAIVTKGSALALVLLNPDTRPLQPAFSTVFDVACIVLLSFLIVRATRRTGEVRS